MEDNNPESKAQEKAAPKKGSKAMRDIIQESIERKTKDEAPSAPAPARPAARPEPAAWTPPTAAKRTEKKARGATKDINLFLHQLSVTLNAGLPLARSMRVLTPRVHHAGLRAALTGAMDEVERGAQFWAALSKYPAFFNKMAVNIIRSGEESGSLVSAIDFLANTRDREQDVMNSIQRAVTYPLVLLVVVIGCVTLLATQVIPVFAQHFKAAGIPLPFPTRVVLNISAVLTNFWIIVLVIAGAAYYVSKYVDFSQGVQITLDRMRTRVPVFGPILVKIYTMQFATITALLLKSGLPVLRTLDLVKDTLHNAFFRQAVEHTREQVERGRRLAESLTETNAFPPIVGDMMAVGEETGALPVVLGHLADSYQKEVENDTAIVGTLLEPILIITLGACVAFVAFSLIMPYFKMAGILSR